MMLRHMKMERHAESIQQAVLKTIADGKVKRLHYFLRCSLSHYLQFRTGDLGGKATNSQFTQAVIDNLAK